eukprot:gene18173-36883_t
MVPVRVYVAHLFRHSRAALGHALTVLCEGLLAALVLVCTTGWSVATQRSWCVSAAGCVALDAVDMNEEELFQCCSQALMSSLDRDCLAGWGSTVKVLSKNGKCVTRQIKSRMD